MATYYQTLGVSEKATAQEIKTAFRRLAKGCHPDTHPGDKAAEERFKEINEAYVTLSDEKKRTEYDQRNNGRTGEKRTNKQANHAPDFDNMNFSGMFDGIFDDMEKDQAKQANDKAEPESKPGRKDDPLNVDHIFSKFMGFKP